MCQPQFSRASTVAFRAKTHVGEALIKTLSNKFLFKQIDKELDLFEMEKIIEIDDIKKVFGFQMFDYLLLLYMSVK